MSIILRCFCTFFIFFLRNHVAISQKPCYNTYRYHVICKKQKRNFKNAYYVQRPIGGELVFYQNELQFLCDTLRKNRVSVFYTAVSTFDAHAKVLGMDGLAENAAPQLPNDLKPGTIYRHTDVDDLCYLYLLLPETSEPTVLFIGPYLTASPLTSSFWHLEQAAAYLLHSSRILRNIIQVFPFYTKKIHCSS